METLSKNLAFHATQFAKPALDLLLLNAPVASI